MRCAKGYGHVPAGAPATHVRHWKPVAPPPVHVAQLVLSVAHDRQLADDVEAWKEKVPEAQLVPEDAPAGQNLSTGHTT